MTASSLPGPPVRINPVSAPVRRWWQELLGFLVAFGGRLLIFGGLALALLLTGALAGVWSYADDQRLPDLIEQAALFQPYVAALDQRRQDAVDTRTEVQQWRQEVVERLRLIGNDQQLVLIELDAMAGALSAELGPAIEAVHASVVHGDRYLWCGALRRVGRWSKTCAALAEAGEFENGFETIPFPVEVKP